MAGARRFLGAATCLALALIITLGPGADPAEASHNPDVSTNQTSGPMYDGKLDHDAAFDFKGGSNHPSNWNFSNNSVSPAPNISQVASGWITWETGTVQDHSGPDYRPNGNTTPNHTEAQEDQTSQANYLENATDAEIRDDTDPVTLAVAFEIQQDATSSTTEDFATTAAAQVALQHTDGSNEFRCLFGLEGGDQIFTGSYIGSFTASDHYYHFASYKNESGPDTRLKCGMALKRTVDTGPGGETRTKIYANTTVPDQKLLGSGRGSIGNGEMTYDVGQLRQISAAPDDPDHIFQLLTRPWVSGLAASFTASCDGLTCTFNGSDSVSANDTIQSFEWDFGDGTNGTGEEVTHTYGSAGTFSVTLTVTNTTGATDNQTQNVTTVLALRSEAVATTAIEQAMTVRTSWDADTRVWVRDPRGGGTDGRLLRFSEDLSTLEVNAVLCEDSLFAQLNATQTELGMTVTKDSGGGLVVVECRDTDEDPARWTQVKDSTGDTRGGGGTLIEGEDSNFQMPLDARTLAHVGYSYDGISVREIGVDDAVDGDGSAVFAEGRANIDVGIDKSPNAPVVICATGAPDGTACWDQDGNKLGDRSQSGTAVEVHDGTVFLLESSSTPSIIHRFTTTLSPLNKTEANGAERPFQVSKSGQWLTLVNESTGSDELDMRFATNGSIHAQTQGLNLTNIESLAWESTSSHIYALNNTELHLINSTFETQEVSTQETEESTDESVLTEEEEESSGGVTGAGGSGETVFNPTPAETAQAIGISGTNFNLFLGIILILSFAGLGAFAGAQGGELTGLIVGTFTGFAGILITFSFGWFPLWAVFVLTLILGAIAIRQLGIGGTNG